MRKRHFILMGPPGAGKGTQASRLASEEGLCQISTGDLLRAAQAEGSDLGRKVAATMAAGELVSDEIILALVDRELDDGRCKSGAVFDGFPRTVEQSRGLEGLLASRNSVVDRVLVIDVPDEELIERLAGRRVCVSCEKLYHIKFDPSRHSDRCDACGGELVQRPDDQPATIRRRLAVYREETQPVVDYYSQNDSASRLGIAVIDGDRAIDEVAVEIRDRLTAVEAET